ncbi:MAG: tRNA pseudouridine(38-40) synthase TruA [Planctomycetota bacterium]
MRFLKITVAYDGTNYVGWQVQPNGVSIQEKLEAAWAKVTGESLRITASGRTDAGVHALAQVCSVATESELEPATLVRAINSETPFDIAVRQIESAPQGFHAIRDATSKTYRYHIQFGRIQDPLRLRTCWFTPVDIDIDAMRTAAGWITGEHDFASFQGAHSDRKTTVRHVTQLEIEPESIHGFPGAVFEISANGFLYNMVRNIVGSLVRVGLGRQSPDWIRWVRDQHDRKHAGQTAPPQGLYLVSVVYPNTSS